MLFLSVVTIGEIRRGLVLLPQGRRRVELETWFHTDMLAWFRDRARLGIEVVNPWAG
jgi:hypothetical protein